MSITVLLGFECLIPVCKCGIIQNGIDDLCSFFHVTHYRSLCLDYLQVSSDSKAGLLG
jgi:hypothetical protein